MAKSSEPVFDPTHNVLDLVAAANKRQDDLRDAEKEHIREMVSLGSQRRSDQLFALERLMKVRDDHAHELRRAESARIDAIRQTDTQAVSTAAQAAAAQAQALATQVAASAEAMRAQVASTAAAASTALEAALAPIKVDIADLRKAQYEAQGQKTQVVESTARGSQSLNAWIAIAAVIVALAVGVAIAAITANIPSPSLTTVSTVTRTVP